MHGSHQYKDIFAQRQHLFLPVSGSFRSGLLGALAIGILTFAAAMIAAQGAETPELMRDMQTRTWGALLFNLLFFYALALGGAAFGSMQDLIGAQWGRPIKRIHEGFSSFLPLATILLIGFLLCVKFRVLGAGYVYKWIANPSMLDHFWGKNVWLTENFMLVRDICALVVILLLQQWHMGQTLRGDLMLMASPDHADKALAAAEKARQVIRYFSAPILLTYAVCFSLICFDMTMSLSPLWFSTLWGGWSFAIMMHTLMATTLITLFALKETPIGHFIARQQFHDIGKLMHGFTVFFAYLTFAHILTYWYGNVPEETEYFLHRLHAPWIYFILAIPLLVFILPLFALIPKAAKWEAHRAIPIASCILVAQWMSYLVVIMPEVAQAAHWKFPWVELGLFLGCLGMFWLSYLRFGQKVPMVNLTDPLLPGALHGDH